MKSHPERAILATATLLLTLGLWPSLAQTVLRFDDFSITSHGYTEVSTNSPGEPWSYSDITGSWTCADTNDCGPVPFRSSRLNSPPVIIGTQDAFLVVNFVHRYSFERDGTTVWDGAQFRANLNGGEYIEVPRGAFTQNGYIEVMEGQFASNNELLGLWVFTGDSPGYDTPAFITSTAVLGPYNAGDEVSVQFLGAWDDCVQATVPNWELKSVEFVESVRTPPTVTDPAHPMDVTVNQGESFTLSAFFDGIPSPSIRWFRNNFPVSGATNDTYTVTNADPAVHSGMYFARAANLAGSTNSRVATVTVVPDTFSPVVLGGIIQLDGNVKMIFDEPMDPNWFDPFSIFISETDNPANITGLSFGYLTNNTEWIFIPATPLVEGINYSIFLAEGAVRDQYGNNLSPEYLGPLGGVVVLFAIDDNQLWSYDGSGDDLYATVPPFYDPAFDDSAWSSGPALLGVESAALPEPIRTTAPLNPGGGGPIVTFYRTRFNLPVPAADVLTLSMRTVIDDSAIIWFNGTEVLNLGGPAEPRMQGQTAARTVGDAVYEGPFSVDTARLVDGQNIIAVANHQASAGSSDTIWGAELIAEVALFSTDPPTIDTQPGPDQTLAERDSLLLSVVASGAIPFHYQWRLDGAPITDANSASYSVASVNQATHAGVYDVVITNNFGSITSAPVTIAVIPDTVSPTVVEACSLLDLVTITIQFSEGMAESAATNIANYAVNRSDGSGGAVAVRGAALSSANTVTLTTDLRDLDNYRVTMENLVDLGFTPNPISPDPSVVDLASEVEVLGVDEDDAGTPAATWRYDQSGADLNSPAVPYYDPAFDDSGWASGQPMFYVDISPSPNLAMPVRTPLSLSNALDQRVITYYYRTTFDFPYDPATTPARFRYVIDDGGIFYLNNNQSLLVRMATPTTFTNLTTGQGLNGESFEESTHIDSSHLVQGSNLIAAEVHQSSTTSSDTAFALQIIAKVPSVTPSLAITGISIDASGNVQIEHNGDRVGINVYIQETSALDGAATVWSTRPGGAHPSPHNAGLATGARFFRASDTP